jgi:hypothetical protein
VGSPTPAQTIADQALLEHGSHPAHPFPFKEQCYFQDHTLSADERFISANLRPTNSSEWANFFGGETTNATHNQHYRPRKGANGTRHKKLNKCVGSSSTNQNFTLGDELTLSGVAEMTNKILVGKAYGRQFNKKSLKTWAVSNWDHLYNPPPKINQLSRGWFMLTFSEHSHAYSVLQKIWFIDSSPILLKLRNPTLNVDNERLDSIPIWVQLPGLSSHLWNKKCFQAIGNHLGYFITTDTGFLETGEMVVARILVLLNLREGLKEFLNLTDLGITRVQILAYEGIPFRCKRCHEYRHIIKDCNYNSRGHKN